MSGGTFGDWDDWLRRTDGGAFEKRLGVETGKALDRLGVFAVGLIRRSIRSGDYAANAALTIALKGSSKPLVDQGTLIKSVTYDRQVENGQNVLYVGAHRMARWKGQEYNLVRILHDGATIRVTPAMLAAVFAKLRAKRGRRAVSGGGGSGAGGYWHIPPRPFILGPIGSPAFTARFDSEMDAALGRALRA